MAHNIFGDRFIAYRQPAWHGLGEVFQDPIHSATEAIKRANADYEVAAAPVTYTAFGRKVNTGQLALVRQPLPDDNQPRHLGFVSSDYELVQNLDLAAIIDPIAKQYPVETCGVLGVGERVFLTLSMGSTNLTEQGEELAEFFLITNGFGGYGLSLCYTSVRVVCQNTLNLGLAEATLNITLAHKEGVAADAAFFAGLMGRMKQARTVQNEVLRRMTLSTLVQAQIEEILLAAYPTPKVPAKVQLLRQIEADNDLATAQESMDKLARIARTHGVYSDQVASFRGGAAQLLEKFNDEFPSLANTPYAVLQAVVECEDYREGRDGVAENVLWGPRARAKKAACLKAGQLVGVLDDHGLLIPSGRN